MLEGRLQSRNLELSCNFISIQRSKLNLFIQFLLSGGATQYSQINSKSNVTTEVHDEFEMNLEIASHTVQQGEQGNIVAAEQHL